MIFLTKSFQLISNLIIDIQDLSKYRCIVLAPDFGNSKAVLQKFFDLKFIKKNFLLKLIRS